MIYIDKEKLSSPIYTGPVEEFAYFFEYLFKFQRFVVFIEEILFTNSHLPKYITSAW